MEWFAASSFSGVGWLLILRAWIARRIASDTTFNGLPKSLFIAILSFAAAAIFLPSFARSRIALRIGVERTFRIGPVCFTVALGWTIVLSPFGVVSASAVTSERVFPKSLVPRISCDRDFDGVWLLWRREWTAAFKAALKSSFSVPHWSVAFLIKLSLLIGAFECTISVKGRGLPKLFLRDLMASFNGVEIDFLLTKVGLTSSLSAIVFNPREASCCPSSSRKLGLLLASFARAEIGFVLLSLSIFTSFCELKPTISSNLHSFY